MLHFVLESADYIAFENAQISESMLVNAALDKTSNLGSTMHHIIGQYIAYYMTEVYCCIFFPTNFENSFANAGRK